MHTPNRLEKFAPFSTMKQNKNTDDFIRKILAGLIIAAFMICLLPSITMAQSKKNVAAHAPGKKSTAVATASFPQSFTGNWKGKLQWMVSGKPTQIFTMQLRIQPADTAGQYTWQIIYGDDNKDNRPYLLKPLDTAKGHWIVDERDGIILDSYVHGDALHGAFTVQGNTIVDNYKVEGDKMYVEFFSIRLADKKQSGKGTDETPFVDSYRIASYQSGVLWKVKSL